MSLYSLLLRTCILIFNVRPTMPDNVTWNFTYLSEFQNLCPYSSFCGVSAAAKLPDDVEKTRPCCDACSCQPGCERDNSCCFGITDPGLDQVLMKCLSPAVTNLNFQTLSYVMIHSCPERGDNDTRVLCEFNVTDVGSFAPVVSLFTGDIYVNKECAACNDIPAHSMVHWGLSIRCPYNKIDFLALSSDFFRSNYVDTHGCYLTYVPPESIDLQSRICRHDIIRECNVSGLVAERNPTWDYCPMFNATFALNSLKIYGNVFCYMCNEIASNNNTLCSTESNTRTDVIPFTVLLDQTHIHVSQQNGQGDCDENSILVRSFKTECRHILCPSGQFRIAGKCDYFADKWIGGPFTIVLKLQPIGDAQTLSINRILTSQIQHDEKSSWFERVAMKSWNIETLYKTSENGAYVEYFVVAASYPYESANPVILQNTIKRTLREVWHFENVDLKIQINPFQFYNKYPSAWFLREGIRIQSPYAYLADVRSLEQRICPKYILHSLNYETSTQSMQVYLNHLFLCKQIDLYTDEYEIIGLIEGVLFKVTNTLLYESEFIRTEAGSIRICLSNFQTSANGMPHRNHDTLLFYYYLLLWLMKELYVACMKYK